MGLQSLDRRVRWGLLALAVGQILFLMGWGVLYVGALLYLITVGLPYPAVLRSAVSRLMVGFVLLLSLVQLASILQFFLFPSSGFGALSLLVTAAVSGLVWVLHHRTNWPVVVFDRRDAAGIGVALFFALPLVVLCFWRNDPARLTAFASVQGVDGANHYSMIAEMARVQHINYRDATYYPKGFHVASAFLLGGLHANQQDLTWLANARLYVAMFIGWGSAVAYLSLYLAVQLCEALATRVRPNLLLLAFCVGPALALLYMLVFTQEGFLSYFYVVAAILCGALFLQSLRFEHREHQWPLVAYLLLSFGVAASWGPLLTPALLVAPLLYVWPHLRSWRRLLDSDWRWVVGMLALQIIPLYLQLRYAHLSTEQGINATGGLKVFDYGVFLADIVVIGYVLASRNAAEEWRRFAGNLLMPFVVLAGVLMCYQYFTVGELRYYVIKTALLLGVLTLILGVVVLGWIFSKSKLTKAQRWLVLPVLVGLGIVALSGMTANPFDRARILFGTLVHMDQRLSTIRTFTDLGLKGQLRTNTVELRYDADNMLVGNPVVNNWANLMQFTPHGAPAAQCASRIFDIQIGQSNLARFPQLIAAVEACVKVAGERREPFVVATDAASAPRLRQVLGDTVIYAY